MSIVVCDGNEENRCVMVKMIIMCFVMLCHTFVVETYAGNISTGRRQSFGSFDTILFVAHP